MQAKEPRAHQRSNHIIRRYHLIREIIGRHDVIIEKVPTDKNITDSFTKALPHTKFDSHVLTYDMRYKGCFSASGSLLEKFSKGNYL